MFSIVNNLLKKQKKKIQEIMLSLCQTMLKRKICTCYVQISRLLDAFTKVISIKTYVHVILCSANNTPQS